MAASILVLIGIIAQSGIVAPTAQSKARAQALLTAGTTLYERGDIADALAKFQAAFALYPSPKLQFNLGQAYRDLGEPLEAREAFDHFLTEATDAPPSMKLEAHKARADVESRLGRAQITVSLDGAVISVDGRMVGTSPVVAPLWLAPGQHQGTVQHPDTEDAVATFRVDAGLAVIVPFVLIRRNRQPALSASAALAPTRSRPPSQADRPTAVDLSRVPSPETASQLRDGTAPPATIEVRPRTPLPRWLPWVGVVTTVALAVAAISVGVSSDSKYDSLKSSCGRTAPGCGSDQIGIVSSRDRTANILWALTGTTAVATGVTVFVNTREEGISALWAF